MTRPELAIVGGLVIVGLPLVGELVRRIALFFCGHRSRIRFWYKGHRFVVVCKRCSRVIGDGRDVTHRIPPELRGVDRNVPAA